VSSPLVLLHGYSASGQAFATWKNAFLAAGRKIEEISVSNYVTLNNAVTVDDIANGFQHALHDKGLDLTPFDAIVHSTGMLVLRSWLTVSNMQTSRQGLLKHLIVPVVAVNVWEHGHDGTNGPCPQTNGPFLSWRNSSTVTGNTSKKRANGRMPFRASLIGTNAGSGPMSKLARESNS
jgi:hypothetical protein